jgi:hypothetical protein
MNLRFTIYDLLFCFLLLAGCSQPQVTKRPPVVEQAQAGATEPSAAQPGEDTARTPAISGPVTFAPVKIGILPLTELSGPSGSSQGTKLAAFVTMLDAFGCQMKAPGVLRFELYEYVPRSAQLKGKQLAIWPDIDLTGPAENHKYWRDFLRAYEFELDTQASRDKTYVLEATCMSPDGKRFSCDYTIRGSQ